MQEQDWRNEQQFEDIVHRCYSIPYKYNICLCLFKPSTLKTILSNLELFGLTDQYTVSTISIWLRSFLIVFVFNIKYVDQTNTDWLSLSHSCRLFFCQRPQRTSIMLNENVHDQPHPIMKFRTELGINNNFYQVVSSITN